MPMNKEAMYNMLVSMRAQIDAILLTLTEDMQAESQKAICGHCGSDQLKVVQSMGDRPDVVFCNGCGSQQ